MSKASRFSLLVVVVVMGLAVTSQAQVLNNQCGKWANYCSGGYCVYNNIWGGLDGQQCITATSCTVWKVKACFSGTGIKSYPNSSRESISGRAVTSSASSSMNAYVSANDWNISWDFWCPGEIMVWINWGGAVGPWGSLKYSNQTIGGVAYDVYKDGYPGFLRRSKTNSASVDAKAIIAFCISKGWWSSGSTWTKLQGGHELTSTGGTWKTSGMNSYSVS